MRDHPLRESFARLSILALYRAGRQADALAVMQRTRTTLRDELGLDPGQALQQLEKQILLQDTALDLPPAAIVQPTTPALEPLARPRRAAPAPVCANCGTLNAHGAEFCNACGAPLVADASVETRKTVTVLFCDVVGFTELAGMLDPEALRALMSRFFELAARTIERHGGMVEKFIGDEVMAVFGVPVVREDDALRAVRAAVEMRDQLPSLETGPGAEGALEVRIGINTGEVVAGDPGAGHGFVTGEAVAIGKRLEQTAGPGEILLGELTHALVSHAVVAIGLEPLKLEGKRHEVTAFRLESVDTGAPASPRRDDAPFVGRQRELTLLRAAWERAKADERCELVTVVGDGGVGKSRLTAEALAGVDARVVSGRCLPYGEGITYWPVVEVLKQLDALPSDDAASATLRSLLGESDRPTSADEIAWAFRKVVEEQAPLVVVFDDLQWGEQTFLDLIESTALLSVGAPLLLVCMARPELVERRPSWPAPLRLEPLAADEADALIGRALPEDLRRRIAASAGGNPLFITEMLVLATDGGELEVPPTLRALLSARLDRLEPRERSLLERGAVEGEVFHRGAVQALAPDEPEVLPRLAALVRRELVRPERPQLPGEDAFRFCHLLIRDAAYDSLPKATRADLHEQFADWLEQRGSELVDLDQLLGYHLSQAHRYRGELGRDDDETRALGERAADAARRRRLPRPRSRRSRRGGQPPRPGRRPASLREPGEDRGRAHARRAACRAHAAGRDRDAARAGGPGGRASRRREPHRARERREGLDRRPLDGRAVVRERPATAGRRRHRGLRTTGRRRRRGARARGRRQRPTCTTDACPRWPPPRSAATATPSARTTSSCRGSIAWAERWPISGARPRSIGSRICSGRISPGPGGREASESRPARR